MFLTMGGYTNVLNNNNNNIDNTSNNNTSPSYSPTPSLYAYSGSSNYQTPEVLYTNRVGAPVSPNGVHHYPMPNTERAATGGGSIRSNISANNIITTRNAVLHSTQMHMVTTQPGETNWNDCI